MKLDEAIKHCEEVAEDKEYIVHSLTKDGWQEHFDNLTPEKETEYKNIRDEMANSCLECAEEHRQLAKWLKDYKRLLEQQPKTGHWIADIDKWGDVVTTVNGYRCDKCNVFNTDKDNYCPNCGAKMESEGEK